MNQSRVRLRYGNNMLIVHSSRLKQTLRYPGSDETKTLLSDPRTHINQTFGPEIGQICGALL